MLLVVQKALKYNLVCFALFFCSKSDPNPLGAPKGLGDPGTATALAPGLNRAAGQSRVAQRGARPRGFTK